MVSNIVANYFNNKIFKMKLIILITLCFFSVSFPFPLSKAFAGGVTIITHGWLGDMDWVDWMGYDISRKINDKNDDSVAEYTLKIFGDHNGITGHQLNLNSSVTSLQATSGQTIIKLDWTEVDGTQQVGTDQLASYVVNLLVDNFDNNTHFLSFPIHLIGHSRGGSLVCEISKLLGEIGIAIDHVTTIDPQPLDGVGELLNYGDAPVNTYTNVLFADNYWQENIVLQDIIGLEVNGAYNRKLLNLGDHMIIGGNVVNFGYEISHADTHLWYHGTINENTPFWDGDINLTQKERDHWWETAESQGSNAGYQYSRNFGGNRLSTYSANTESNSVIDGYYEMYGGQGSRTELDMSNANWPNVINVELLKDNLPLGDSSTITIGETIEVNYVGQDYDSESGVTLYLDADRNPYNSNNIITSSIGNNIHNATPNGYLTSTVEIDTSSFPVASGYIYVQIADELRTRYMYASTKLNFVSAAVYSGDVNRDGNVDSVDTFLSLQVMANVSPSTFIYTIGDVDGDQKIGYLEAIHALQVASDIRPKPLPDGTVRSATGRIWMDRNLGAYRVATSPTDTEAYGDLYQWGRGADGHQLRTSSTTTTRSYTDVPGHGNFIGSWNSDWRRTPNNNLWQGESGINNPCPAGFRLPTLAEFQLEINSWSSQNENGAYSSPLKLTRGGARNWSPGASMATSMGGRYWTSTIDGSYANIIHILSSVQISGQHRAFGMSVRCIKCQEVSGGSF